MLQNYLKSYQQAKTLAAEPPNSRMKEMSLARQSFLCHLRPKQYPASSLSFRHIFYLGFIACFLLVVECITGALLMLYYTPTPEDAYNSILRLGSEIPFGQLIRNLHRLAGDLLIIASFLHLLRTVLTGSYRRQRRFTWVTGVILFLSLIALAFSGYLLPWDQLSYWAVTVGTSLFGYIPLIGETLQELLRGGSDIGAAGLLRFYVLHVVLLPALALFFLAIHYYRIVRLHGISLPINKNGQADGTAARPVPFLPFVLLNELRLILIGLIVLIFICGFLYNAPLGPPADSLHTPVHIQSPWFFLSIQGLLSLGLPSQVSLGLSVVLALLVVAFPYLDQGRRQNLTQRPKMAVLLTISLGSLIFLGYVGAHENQLDQQSPTAILDRFAPQDQSEIWQTLPDSGIVPGVYPLGRKVKPNNKELGQLITALHEALLLGMEQNLFREADGVLLIEPWQVRLTRITLRFTSYLPGKNERQTFERMVYRPRLNESVQPPQLETAVQ